MTLLREPHMFEAEVRRIGRALWPTLQYSGPIVHKGRERDGIFVTDDVVHYIEVTVSKQEAKAIADIDKLKAGIISLQKEYPQHHIKGWFITLDEPPGEQGTVIRTLPRNIEHKTFDQFRAKLINARDYLALREQFPFGSARVPGTNDHRISNTDFVPPTLFIKGDPKPKTFRDVAKLLQDGKGAIVVLGDFGTGKSMLLKHIFLELKNASLNNHDRKFPVLLNLRDHREQTDPAEALFRHAKRVGFPSPDQLVRAWNAGYVHLMLDGFDEIPPRTTAQTTKRMRDIRYGSVQLVQSFLRNMSADGSIIVAGRSNFFSSDEELNSALGTEKAKWVELGEWTEAELNQYLRRKNYSKSLPTWLPKRPLLVGYLLSRALLKDGAASVEDKAEGWCTLLRAIYARETEQMELGLEPRTLLHIAARLAGKARTKTSRLGPVNFAEAKAAFEEVVRAAPEDRAINALLRLPGLRSRDETRPIDGRDIISEDTPANSNEFVDEDFADALAGFDLVEFLATPYQSSPTYWNALQHPLYETGVGVASFLLGERNLNPSKLNAAYGKLNREYPNSIGNFDIMSALKNSGLPLTEGILISNVHVPCFLLDYDDSDVSRVQFKDCYFDTVRLMSRDVAHLPDFIECCFGGVLTWFTEKQLATKFTDCAWDNLKLEKDGAAHMGGHLPVSVRVLTKALERLYVQKGNGRREGALRGGLDGREQKCFANVLEALRRHQGATSKRQGANIVWHPVRAFAENASAIMRHPDPKTHPLVNELWNAA